MNWANAISEESLITPGWSTGGVFSHLDAEAARASRSSALTVQRQRPGASGTLTVARAETLALAALFQGLEFLEQGHVQSRGRVEA